MSINEKETVKNSEIKKTRQYFKNIVNTVRQLRYRKKQGKTGTSKRKPSGKVAYLFLYFGVIALASSLITNSSILAFIGLGFLLWGALFLYTRPVKYVREEILDSTIVASLTTIDKILSELHFEGKGIYLPPRQLEGFEKSVVLVPSKMEMRVPLAEETAEGRIFPNPEAAYITAPGQGLINLYEKKLGLDFSRTNLNDLKGILPPLLVENLEILDSLEIDDKDDRVYVRMRLSAFKNICGQLKKNSNVCSRLGCPLCSSIAGILAKATGKAVIIEKDDITSNGETIEAWYRVIQE